MPLTSGLRQRNHSILAPRRILRYRKASVLANECVRQQLVRIASEAFLQDFPMLEHPEGFLYESIFTEILAREYGVS